MGTRPMGAWQALLAAACATALHGCGGVTVTPTSPTTGADPVTQGTPTVLRFRGDLADGGVFRGYILYGSRDIDPRAEFGRFRAAYWETEVHGGSATGDTYFTHSLGGRALLETYSAPFPTIGLVFLWPLDDPAEQALTPHFHSGPKYQVNSPPGPQDFGDLVPGSFAQRFGIYRDGQGGITVVTSVQFDPLPAFPVPRFPGE
jgi:hypothetical protein